MQNSIMASTDSFMAVSQAANKSRVAEINGIDLGNNEEH